MADPGGALVPDDRQVPRARGELVRAGRPKPAGLVLGGEPGVVVQLVLVRPPVDEDEVRAATVMRADEAHPVAIAADSWARQPLPCGGHGRVDEGPRGTLAPVGDAVQLEAPAVDGQQLEAANRPRGVRLRRGS